MSAASTPSRASSSRRQSGPRWSSPVPRSRPLEARRAPAVARVTPIARDPDTMSEPAARGRGALLGFALNRLATRWAIPGAGRVTLCSLLVGLIAGLGAVAFLRLLELMYRYVLDGLMHLQLPPTGEGTPHVISYPWPWWMVLLVPTVGGLISGMLVFTLAPEAEGHGTDALIRAYHRGAGQIRARVPLVKGIASVITIGTGGSAGQEGP